MANADTLLRLQTLRVGERLVGRALQSRIYAHASVTRHDTHYAVSSWEGETFSADDVWWAFIWLIFVQDGVPGDWLWLSELEWQLAQLPIGDALVNVDDTQFHIDHVHPGDEHEPCYMLMRGNRVLLLTPHNHEDDRQLVRDFITAFHWEHHDTPQPGVDWCCELGGAENNPLWDDPISEIATAGAEYFAAPSPATGQVRTQITLAVRKNHTPRRLRGGAIYSIHVRKSRGCEVTDASQYAVGRVYGIKRRSTEQPICAYAQLVRIDERTLECLPANHPQQEGFASWTAYLSMWTRVNGTIRAGKRVWVLTFATVYTALPSAETCPVCTQPVRIEFIPLLRQLALPEHAPGCAATRTNRQPGT